MPRNRAVVLARAAADLRALGLISLAFMTFTIFAASLPACRRRAAPMTEPRVELTGVVVDEDDGRPVAGASVEVGNDPADRRVPLATTRTDARGRFRISNLPPGVFRVWARARDRVAASARVEVATSRTAGLGEPLILKRAVALAGTVEDARGAPVPLARVLALPVGLVEDAAGSGSDSHPELPRSFEASADPDGHFRIRNLPAGAYRLIIEAPGVGTSVAGPIRAPDDAVRVLLPGVGRSLVGRVLRQGQPARSARVALAGEGLADVRRVDTDLEGRFVFAGLGPGHYTLRADSGGLVSAFVATELDAAPVADARAVPPALAPGRDARPKASSRSESMSVAAPRSRREIVLELRPGVFLRGHVVDERGLPVPAAEVLVDTAPATDILEPISADASGGFAAGPFRAGRYRLEARRAGWVAPRTLTVDLPAPGPAISRRDAASPAEATRDPPGVPGSTESGATSTPFVRQVRLELLRAAELSGRVVDERGAPLRDARIRNALADIQDLGVIWSPLPMAAEAAAMKARGPFAPSSALRPSLPPQGAAAGSLRRDDASPANVAFSDGAGRFRLANVTPGRLRVAIAHPDAVPVTSSAMDLSPGQVQDLGVISMRAAIALTGHVTATAGGGPIVGARLTATRMGPPRAAMPVGPSEMRVDAGAGAGAAADAPIAGAAAKPPASMPSWDSPDAFATTDESGAFSLRLGDGQFQVRISASGMLGLTQTVSITARAPGGRSPAPVERPTPVTWQLAPGPDAASLSVEDRARAGDVDTDVRIAGLVKDALGRAVAGASVRPFVHAGVVLRGAMRSTVTDTGGHFQWQGVLPAPATGYLEVSHRLFATVHHPWSAAPPGEGNAGGDSVAVTLPIPGAVRGEVHEAVTGGPVPRFSIEARGPDGARTRTPDLDVVTRGSSRPAADVFAFELARLLPGAWDLTVSAPGFETSERSIDVPSAADLHEFSVTGLRIELVRLPPR